MTKLANSHEGFHLVGPSYGKLFFEVWWVQAGDWYENDLPCAAGWYWGHTNSTDSVGPFATSRMAYLDAKQPDDSDAATGPGDDGVEFTP